MIMRMTFFQMIIIPGFFVLLVVLFYPRIESFFIFYPDRVLEAAPQGYNLQSEEVSFETPDHIFSSCSAFFFPAISTT